MPAAVFYPWLTLRHGLHRRRAFLSWIDECLARLDRRPEAAEGEVSSEEFGELLHMLKMTGDEEAPAGRGGSTDE